MAPDREAQILAELRALRSQVHAFHAPTAGRYSWLKVVIHDLEYNPQTQYKIHLYAAMFWIFNAVIVTLAMVLFNDFWQQIAVFYVAIVSLYSNFATDYGAMSASLAASQHAPLPEIPAEPPHG